MLANEIVLDSQAGSDTTFRVLRIDGDMTTRRKVGTTPANAVDMVIKHQTSGKGIEAVDRHNITFTRKGFTSTGKPLLQSVSITLTQPQSPDAIIQDLLDLVVYAADFVTDGAIASVTTMDNVKAITNGES